MLYQLFSNQFKVLSGGVVKITGPFDTYGFILKEKDNGIYLIRGTGHNKPNM